MLQALTAALTLLWAHVVQHSIAKSYQHGREFTPTELTETASGELRMGNYSLN